MSWWALWGWLEAGTRVAQDFRFEPRSLKEPNSLSLIGLSLHFWDAWCIYFCGSILFEAAPFRKRRIFTSPLFCGGLIGNTSSFPFFSEPNNDNKLNLLGAEAGQLVLAFCHLRIGRSNNATTHARLNLLDQNCISTNEQHTYTKQNTYADWINHFTSSFRHIPLWILRNFPSKNFGTLEVV